MDITNVLTASNGLLAFVSLGLLSWSAMTAVRARSAQTMSGQRKWSTISLSAVTLDYVVKCGVIASGANLAGLLSFLIVTSRSAMVWGFHFTDKDTRFRKALQQGISWGTFILCAGIAYASQIALKGVFDPYTLLAIAGIGCASLADSLNIIKWRRRSHLTMAGFQLAFGIYTQSWALVGKASVDLGACVFFDPLFGDARREQIKAALRSLMVHGLEPSGPRLQSVPPTGPVLAPSPSVPARRAGNSAA